MGRPNNMVPTGEYLKASFRPYDAKTGEPVKEGTVFYGKQTSVADAIAFQANKGAIEIISNPLEPMDSTDIQFDLYTTSQLSFTTFGEVDLDNHSYTIDAVIIIKDTINGLLSMRTGHGKYPKVLRLK